MARAIDAIYLNIAQNMANSIKNEWDKSTISAEFFCYAANFKGEYARGESKGFFEVYDDAFDDFEELHAITTEGGKNRWNRATFTLSPEGKFSIDFKWDQALADEVRANS